MFKKKKQDKQKLPEPHEIKQCVNCRWIDRPYEEGEYIACLRPRVHKFTGVKDCNNIYIQNEREGEAPEFCGPWGIYWEEVVKSVLTELGETLNKEQT